MAKKEQKIKKIYARTITITSLGSYGRQQITSTYNWNNSSDHPLFFEDKSEIKSGVERFLKHLGSDHYNQYKKPRSKRIVRLTTSNGTYSL